MNTTFRFKDVTDSQKKTIREYLAKRTRRFDRLLKTYAEDAVRFQVNVRAVTEGRLRWEVRGVLKLPTGTLVSDSDSGDTVGVALDEMSDQLHRMLRRHRSLLRKNRESQDLVSAVPFLGKDVARNRREEFFRLLRPRLRGLVMTAKKEIRLLELNGLLPVNHVEPNDIVDEVVLRAWESFPSRGEIRLGSWLTRILYEVLHDVEERTRENRKPVELLDLPEAGEELSILDDPEEEHLSWEAVFPDERVPDPLSNLTHEEEHDAILGALLALPVDDRIAFTLRELEGYSAEEVGEIQGRNEEDVEKSVEEARRRLLDEFSRAESELENDLR